MKKIEYFYSAHSAYAYLGQPRLQEICAAQNCEIIHRPISLRKVVTAVGALPFRKRAQPHVDYFFGRQLERWSEVRSVPILNHRPTFHDAPLDLPNGFLIAAIEGGLDIDKLSFALLQGHWRDDVDLSDEQTLLTLASSVGIDGAPLLQAALSDEVQKIHAENTDEAVERGLLGSPTYILDGDMFYGQDSLEMVERAIHTPFSPSTFKNPRVDAN